MVSPTPIPPAQSSADDLTGIRSQDDWYAESIARYGSSLARLARGYEARPDRRQDLLQAIHIAVWESFAIYDQRCSLRTWVYRAIGEVVGLSLMRWILVAMWMRWTRWRGADGMERCTNTLAVGITNVIDAIENVNPIISPSSVRVAVRITSN